MKKLNIHVNVSIIEDTNFIRAILIIFSTASCYANLVVCCLHLASSRSVNYLHPVDGSRSAGKGTKSL